MLPSGRLSSERARPTPCDLRSWDLPFKWNSATRCFRSFTSARYWRGPVCCAPSGGSPSHFLVAVCLQLSSDGATEHGRDPLYPHTAKPPATEVPAALPSPRTLGPGGVGTGGKWEVKRPSPTPAQRMLRE